MPVLVMGTPRHTVRVQLGTTLNNSASSSSFLLSPLRRMAKAAPMVEDSGAWPASSHESDASSEEEVVEAEGATSAQWTLDEPKNVVDGSDNGADRDTSDVEPRERKRKKDLSNQWAEVVDDDKTERVLQKLEASSVICVGASNKVFKCRVCPKIVCLSEESMESHLASKLILGDWVQGHARSLKQLAEGRLKLQLDSDGDEEEEGETHAKRCARTITTAKEEKKTVKRKRDSGRQRMLSERISCANKLKLILTEETVQLCNEIVPELTMDDHGLVVEITNYAAIHAALGLIEVPVGLEQGVTPEASFLSFQTWLIHKAHDNQLGVGPSNQVGGPLSTCWHHLSDEQVGGITHLEWLDLDWASAIRRAGPAIPGPLCLVLKMTGTGRGCAHMYQLHKIFG